MKVLIECEEDNELEVVIRCNKIDDEVRRIISLFEDKHFIIGKLDNRSYQIKLSFSNLYTISRANLSVSHISEIVGFSIFLISLIAFAIASDMPR